MQARRFFQPQTGKDEPAPKPAQPPLSADLIGQFAGEPAPAVDDGGEYGDPHAEIDDRPDFVKEDERGWVRLWPFRR